MRLVVRMLLVTAAIILTALALPVAALAAPTSGQPDGAVLAQDGETQSVRGRLRGEEGGVPGVTITVTRDGEPVAETETDDEGNWRVELPEPGTYTVAIDVETLPDELTVRDDQFVEQEKEVAAGDSVGVLFPLVAGEGGLGTAAVRRFINLAVQGLKIGAIIAITSVGLSLIFGVTGLVNFAHGELVTLGAVIAYAFNSNGLQLILATIIAVIVMGAFGGGLELAIFRPLRRRKAGLISLLLITIGLSFFVRHLILIYYGAGAQKYPDYAIQRDLIELGPVALPPRDMSVIVISILVLAGVGLMLEKTKLGTAMRAVADNRDLAESSGIDVKKVILAVWITGGGLAALGGVFQGLTTGAVQWDMGFALLLLMFAGVIVGGIGTAYGAMFGGLLVGLASEISTFWFSVELKLVFAFLLLIIALLLRPQGLLGKRERIG